MTKPNLSLQNAILNALSSSPKTAREIAQLLRREEYGIKSCLLGLRRRGKVAMHWLPGAFKAAYWEKVKK